MPRFVVYIIAMDDLIINQFKKIVGSAAINIMANVKRTLDGAQDAPVEDWVMVTKMQKHLGAGNQKKAAVYIACRLEAYPSPLSEWARGKLRATPLRAVKGSDSDQIHYTNPEGTPRAINFKRAV